MSGSISFFLVFLFFANISRIVSTATKCDEFGYKLPNMEGSVCDTECEKPLTCVNETRDSRCRCLPPYKRDGTTGGCNRDIKCEPDEILEDYECVKRCDSDAYRSNGICLKYAHLGESCLERDQCKAAFADCQNGTCVCLSGFLAIDENTCQSQKFFCPFGEALQSAGTLVECGEVKSNHSETKHIEECPTGYSCVFGGASYPSLAKITRGHCCPVWNRECPVGEQHPNAICPPLAEPSEPGTTRCPSKTHHCYEIRGPWKYTEQPLCCPRACPEDEQFLNGQCLRLRALGEPCQLDDECMGRFGGKFACKQGRCACADGYFHNAHEWRCEIRCAEGEHKHPIMNTCIKSKKLGESCNPEDPFVTGCHLSKCSPRTRTCACECDEIPLDEYSCTGKPVCARVPQRQTNFTFCRIEGGDNTTSIMSGNVVKICPPNSYCGKYRSTVGVCCPKTEPTCPNGSKGSRKCDPSKSDSCGGGERKCYQHTEDLSVDSEPMENHICCSP